MFYPVKSRTTTDMYYQVETRKKLGKECKPLLDVQFDSSLQKVLFCNIETLSTVQLKDHLFASIDSWHKHLAEGYRKFNSSKEKLTPYYNIALKILRGAKIDLLKVKLREEEIPFDEIKDLLERINEIVADIFIAYENMNSAADPYLLSYSEPYFSSTVTTTLDPSKIIVQLVEDRLNPSSIPSPIEFDHCIAVHKYEIEKKRVDHLFKQAWLNYHYNKILQLTPGSDSINWAERLIEAISRITNIEDLCCIAKVFTAVQVRELIKLKEELDWKFPYILSSLDYNVLEDILEALSRDQQEEENEDLLKELNEFLKKMITSHTEIQSWMQEKFVQTRQDFTDTRNKFSDTIDIFSKRFRKYVAPHQITEQDLNDIRKLKRNIKIRRTNIRTLQLLYKDIVKDPESIKLLNEDIVAYDRDIMRLSNKPSPREQSLGRLYDIICRKVFEENNLYDEATAIECVGIFGLMDSKSLRGYGLLSSLTDEEYEAKKEDLTTLNKIARERLAEANIYTVTNLKELKIYNAKFLRQHLDVHVTQ